jgi:hypothetical protein
VPVNGCAQVVAVSVEYVSKGSFAKIKLRALE